MTRLFPRARPALALFITLLLWAPARGQERPWARLFGARPAEKAPVKSPAAEPNRLAEIQVEIAWLADPVTFPYFLEARATGGSLEVRGYVPNRSVRDQALNLARVYSSLAVVDALKEHPSLLVKTGSMSLAQLQTSVTSALREALPKHAGQLQVQCGRDGTVAVAGVLPTHEERLAVSHALRRLYGCTSVQNQTRVPGEPAQVASKRPEANVPPVKTAPANNIQVSRVEKRPADPSTQGSELPRPSTPPQQPESKPRVEATRGSAEEVAAPTPAPASAAMAAQLKKRIEDVCTGVKGVLV